MLKNKLIEKLLCERYKIKNKNCDCNVEMIELGENKGNGASEQDIIQALAGGGVQAAYELYRASKIPVEVFKLLTATVPSKDKKLSQEELTFANTQNIAQPYDFNRNYLGAEPRTTRVREFGQATGQVISPR